MTASNAWQVLVLFLIPIGGGIPAGVLLAQKHTIPWPGMMILYFISDVILACLFEPVMLMVISAAKRSVPLTQFIQNLKASIKKTTPHFGSAMGPLALILIAFGADPMTGRAAAVAAGHGFITGWLLAITGDMFYFTLLMVSTLWLNNILGDGTWTTIIILVLMTVVPMLIRRFRQRRKPAT